MSAGPERLVVLLGYPLGHSRSAAIHNASFEAQQLPFRYRAHPVPPERLGSTIQELRQMGFAGANVTVPHKQSILDFVDEKSEIVEAVGAANTLVWCNDPTGESSGSIYADNTDVGGFLATLDSSPYLNRACVILGSGGAARAVAFGLLSKTDSPNITIAARSQDRAVELVESLRSVDPEGKLEAVGLDDAKTVVREAGLIVNATPVGMHPHVDSTPWTDFSVVGPGQLVYDLIYNPVETKFLELARRAGAEVMGGLDMLLEQAVLSYRHWTGRDMDRRAAKEALIR